MVYKLLGIWLELAPNHYVYICNVVSDLGHMVGAGTQPLCVYVMLYQILGIWSELAPKQSVYVINVVSDLGLKSQRYVIRILQVEQ